MNEWEMVLRAVLEVVEAGVIVISASGTINYASQIVSDIWGYSHEELVGQPIDLLYQNSPAAERSVGGAASMIAALLRPTKQWVALMGRHKDGSALSLQARVSELDAAAQLLLATIRVAPSHFATADERAAMLDAALDAIVTVDQHGTTVEFNPAAEQMFGYRRAEVLGRELTSLIIPPAKRARYRQGLARFLAAGAGDVVVRRSEIIAMRADGTTFPIELSIARISTAGGPMLTGYIRDITDQRRAEQDLERYAERIKHLYELAQAILSVQSPDEIARASLQHVCELMPCRWASVVIHDLEEHEAQVLAFHTEDVAITRTDVRYPIDQVWYYDWLKQGHVHVVNDMHPPMQLAPIWQVLSFRDLRSYINVPLMVQGQLIGTLNLGSDQPNAYHDDHTEIAREAANQLAVAIQNGRLFDQLRAAYARMDSLSRRLLEAQENERRHIARELHDEIGQSLTGLKINLYAIRDQSHQPGVEPYLEESFMLVDRLLQQVRSLSLELRPSMLDDFGLVSATRWYVARVAERSGLQIALTADTNMPRISSEIETACFRVVQEALTNVIRHAQAQHVDVALRMGETALELTVGDDGVGFDVARARASAVGGNSLGLLGMEERAQLVGGWLRVSSEPQRGTTIRASFPLTPRHS